MCHCVNPFAITVPHRFAGEGVDMWRIPRRPLTKLQKYRALTSIEAMEGFQWRYHEGDMCIPLAIRSEDPVDMLITIFIFNVC